MNYKMIAMKISMPLILAGLLQGNVACAEGGKKQTERGENNSAKTCKIIPGTQVAKIGAILSFGDLKFRIDRATITEPGTNGYEGGIRAWVSGVVRFSGMENEGGIEFDISYPNSGKMWSSKKDENWTYLYHICGQEVSYGLSDKLELTVGIW